MVLTHFECWAHGSSSESSTLSNDSIERRSNKIDPFNPVMICPNRNINDQLIKQSNVSHLSSNGYYGFAQVSDDRDKAMVSSSTAFAVNGIDTVLEAPCYMDVEQQHNTNEGENTKRNYFSNDTCCDNRKRVYVDENEINTSSKRFCSKDNHGLITENEHFGLEFPNVICTMDQADDTENRNINNQTTTSGHEGSNVSFKSNTYDRRYNDISRCLTSHMI